MRARAYASQVAALGLQCLFRDTHPPVGTGNGLDPPDTSHPKMSTEFYLKDTQVLAPERGTNEQDSGIPEPPAERRNGAF